MRGTVVRDWHANSIAFDPVLRALKATLLAPIPDSAANIGDLFDWAFDAFAVLNMVADVASEAGSSVIVRGALIGHWHTHSLGVEDPVLRAHETVSLAPVPLGAPNIRYNLDRGLFTLAIVEVITNVASHAGAEVVVGCTVVRDGHTNSIAVENPVLRAPETFAATPIPFSAADVGDFFDGALDTFAILEVIAEIAGCAGSGIIVGSAFV